MGPFETTSTSTTFHEPTCPVFAQTRWRNEYAIKLNMKPFLKKTYELILQSSFGAGGSSFSRTLKSYRTVSRVHSPAFQLFDRFNDLGETDYMEVFRDLTDQQNESNAHRFQLTPGGGHTVRTWTTTNSFTYDASLICPDPEEDLAEVLELFPKILEEIFRSGDSLPTDRDEFGNTLLHVSAAYLPNCTTWHCRIYTKFGS